MTPSERPPLQTGPQVWHGSDMAARQNWLEATAAPLADRSGTLS